ncbi:DUF3313 domain-containing protein [Vibrio comitans]|uniref:Lipoprotein n=1 Tax=Vibrio comitans NBRC 102076 TaxID=1219078 RepID=A0A4Y3IHJ7_9VIBR|nr:DUF3313 domain-containing protein [Vibrio comitans]GEA58851.1 hypothetical protein VCO01S_00440 [Vibrio comitans NBRC 102076]
MSDSNKIFKKSLSIILAGLTLVLTGCANNSSISDNDYSGWLQDDYVMLQQDENHPGSRNWIHSDEKLSQYTKVLIDPVAVQKTAKEDFGVSQDVIDESTQYFQQALEKHFSTTYEVVNEPGQDVLRISATISGTELTKQDIKVYQLIPVALVINVAKEVAGARDRVAIISMEAHATDSLTNDKVAMVVQKSAQKTSVQVAEDLNTELLMPTLDFWAIKAKERMDSAHQ